MKIVIPRTPPSLNKYMGRGNTYAYRTEKQTWTDIVYALCRASAQRPQKPYTRAMVRIDYYFGDARRRDPDNYSGKLLMDGLVKSGVLQDDDFAHICTALHAHIDRAAPRTEITITPMWDEA